MIKPGWVPTRIGATITVIVLCYRACGGCYVTFDTEQHLLWITLAGHFAITFAVEVTHRTIEPNYGRRQASEAV